MNWVVKGAKTNKQKPIKNPNLYVVKSYGNMVASPHFLGLIFSHLLKAMMVLVVV